MHMERQSIYRELKHIDLGLIDYAEAWDMQKSLMEERKQNNIPDTLLLLEHPNTYTLGKVTDKENLVASEVYLKENGNLIGTDIYSPSDSSTGLTSGRPSETWSVDATGTGDFVPLGGAERWSVNTTLTARVGQSSKLEYNGFF